MEISSIVNTPAYTKNGNKYDKFNGGKIVAAAALPASTLIYSTKNGAFSKDAFQTLKNIGISKGKFYALTAAGAAIYAAAGLGIGAIIDTVVNKVRQTKADNATQSGEQTSQTQA